MYIIVLNNFSWCSNYHCIWLCNRLENNSISTYVAPIGNLYITKNHSTGTDINIIAYMRSFQTTLICSDVYVVHYATIPTYLTSSIHDYATIMIEGQSLVASVLRNAYTSFQRE